MQVVIPIYPDEFAKDKFWINNYFQHWSNSNCNQSWRSTEKAVLLRGRMTLSVKKISKVQLKSCQNSRSCLRKWLRTNKSLKAGCFSKTSTLQWLSMQSSIVQRSTTNFVMSKWSHRMWSMDSASSSALILTALKRRSCAIKETTMFRLNFIEKIIRI